MASCRGVFRSRGLSLGANALSVFSRSGTMRFYILSGNPGPSFLSIIPTVFLNEWSLAIGSGLLLTLAFPPFDFPLLAWVSLVPLLQAVEGKTSGKAFLLGWAAGTAHFAGLVHWVTNSMIHYGGVSQIASFFLLTLLAGYLGIYVGIFAGVIGRGQVGLRAEPALIAPCAWVLLEYVRAHLFTGFPWGLLGYSQYSNLTLIQTSDITGVYGVSFVLVTLNTCLYLVMRWVRVRPDAFPWRYGLFAILLLALCLGYGSVRQHAIQQAGDDMPQLRVALIQGNIDQAQKWDPAFFNETLRIHVQLTEEAIAGGCDLVVWPETSVPCYFSPAEHGPILSSMVKQWKVPLLFGSLSADIDPNELAQSKFFNSAFLLSPKGLARYDKVHLVPFGEFVPLKQVLSFVEKMAYGIGDYSPGSRSGLFSLSQGRVGLLICYEVIFPDLCRHYAQKGADFLATITNDAWFGRTGAPLQHFSMAVFRAIENRTAVVRAANSGISGVIAPTGKIMASTALFTRCWVRENIPLGSPGTFYSRYGDVMVAGVGVIAVLFWGVGSARRRGIREER